VQDAFEIASLKSSEAKLSRDLQHAMTIVEASEKKLRTLEQRVADLAAPSSTANAAAANNAPAAVAPSAPVGSGIDHWAMHVTKHQRQVHSQGTQDGSLEYIFSKIGQGARYFVEFGFSSPSYEGTVCVRECVL
jgi:hypothetical protein